MASVTRADSMDNPAQPRSQEPFRKSRRLRGLVSTLVALSIVLPLGLYSWRYWVNPCEVDAVQEASTYLVTQLTTYDNLFQVAATASRTTLDRPVLEMQRIHLDTRELAVPACMQTAKDDLLNYMATVVRAFRAWEAGEPDTTITGLLRQSDTYYDDFYKEVKAVHQCAPFCIP